MGRGEERRTTVTREDGGSDTTTHTSTPTLGSTSTPLPIDTTIKKLVRGGEGRGGEMRKTVTREDGGGDTTTHAFTLTSGWTSTPLPPQPAGYARTTTRIRTMLSRAERSPARDDVVQCKDDALRNMYEFLHAQLNYAIMHVEMRKYSNKGVGVMAAAGEVTRLSPTPIQRSIIN